MYRTSVCSSKTVFQHAGTERSQLAITAGTEVGALLVDGLGDGALIECPGEDLEFLRLMTFGMLQVRPVANLCSSPPIRQESVSDQSPFQPQSPTSTVSSSA